MGEGRCGLSSQRVVLDACVLINLIASGEIISIRRAIEMDFMICPVVEKESISVQTGDPLSPRQLIDLAPFIQSGVLSIRKLADQREEELFVDYAARLDDGEAMSLAIVHSVGCKLATDDAKARKIFIQAINQPDQLLSTTEIIRIWAIKEGVTQSNLKAVLLAIQQKARFFPSKNDPNCKWWFDVLAE